MEDRLVPVNTLVALVQRGDLNRAVLTDAGYELAGLEVPMTTEFGQVVIDVVLANGQTGHLLPCEAKSGANIEVEQARRYAGIDARGLARTCLVNVQKDPWVEPVYVGSEEHVERFRLGFLEAGVDFPIIAMGELAVSLRATGDVSDALRDAFSSPLNLSAPVPELVSFDHESDVEIVKPHVMASLVSLMVRKEDKVSLSQLVNVSARYHMYYQGAAHSKLTKKVARAMQEIAAEHPDRFDFVRGAQDGIVVIKRSPEQQDPRGRTQAYRSLTQRKARRIREVDPNQLDLFADLDKPGQSGDSGDDADPRAGG